MRLRDDANATVLPYRQGPWNVLLRKGAFSVAAGSLLTAMLGTPAAAGPDINTGATYNASGLGTSDTPAFKGGTLKLDTTATIGNNFAVEDDAGNTIDADGHAATLSGVFSGTGPLTITDSVGGGTVTLSNSGNTYTGITTVNTGATLALSGTGAIPDSVSLADNGTFSIAATTAGASVISLTGSGVVSLGAQTLTLTTAAGTFSGVISGTGVLEVTGGTEILTGANTYSGGTTITAGTLQVGGAATSGSIAGNVSVAGTLAFDRADDVSFGGTISGTGGVSQLGAGNLTLTAVDTYTGTTTITAGTLTLASGASIAGSSVSVAGLFDISATSGASVASLSGAGTVQLGAQTLTITAANGVFSGVLAGSGNLVLSGGSELLSGANTYTGSTTVNGGTLKLGSATIADNISDYATVAFDSNGTVAMNGVISGTGNVSQIASGVTTVTAAQTYTGTTTITEGELALSGAGAIAGSSGLTDNAAFSIAAAAGNVSLTSLSGSGTVLLGGVGLTLTNASGAFSGVISGSGGLTLTGGDETLSGANTFTGVTTISGGTLILSEVNSLTTSSGVVDNATLDVSQIANGLDAAQISIVSLSGSGAVVLGGNTLILTGAADTFSGTISGTGGLLLTGGTETLTGASTYTGLTTITGSTLVLSGAGSLSASGTVSDSGVFDISGVTTGPTVTLASLAGSGTVKLGAENLDLANAATEFSGAISGTGALVVSGGTQILSGTNSYTGGTTISAGTLQIGRGLASGSIVGNVADNGTLAFDRSDSNIFAGAISGNGAVLQMGSGTTILTATETYTGGTTISAGTLQIGNGAASGAIAGNVTDNGTLAFGRSDGTTFGGTISGTGGVAVLSGATTFSAIESYSGPTTINSLASLALTGTAGISGSSGVTDNGVFDVSAATTPPQIASLAGSGTVALGGQTLTLTNGAGDFSGTISGPGGVVLGGGAIQTLAGTNGYTGGTVVNGGTLSVTGSIAASSGVTVNSGGTLAGSGTVPGVTLASGGAIAPGAAGSGTLSVHGSVAFSTGSKFVVELNSASAGKLSASGAEALAGTLSVASTDGTYLLGQKITVLTAAGGVSGTFALAPIASTGAQFSSTLSYDADDVYLEINLAKLSPLLPAGATVNEAAAIGGIDAGIAAGDSLPAAFESLGTVTPAALQTDAGQFAGEVAADVAQVGDSLFNPFLTAIFDHVADEQPTGAPRSKMPAGDAIWVTGFDGTNHISDDAGTAGIGQLKSNLTGIVAGGDWDVMPDVLFGVAGSAGSANFHLSDGDGQGKVTAVQLGVYGLVQFSRHLYGSFAGAVSLDNATTNRTLTVSGTDTLAGKFDGRVFGGRYETGAEMGWITPYVALQDDLFSASSYKETASSGAATFALAYGGRTTNAADMEVGFRQRGDINLEGWTLKLSDRLAWQHDMSATPSADPAFAALPGSTFTVYGVRSGKNAALFSLGAGLDSHEGFGLNLHFDSAIASRSQTYTESAAFTFAW